MKLEARGICQLRLTGVVAMRLRRMFKVLNGIATAMNKHVAYSQVQNLFVPYGCHKKYNRMTRKNISFIKIQYRWKIFL